MTQRVQGKTSFAHVKDMSGAIQLFVKRDRVAENVYDEFKKWDLGDIVAARGELIGMVCDVDEMLARLLQARTQAAAVVGAVRVGKNLEPASVVQLEHFDDRGFAASAPVNAPAV